MNKSKKQLILSVLLLTSVFLILFLVIWPTIRDIRKISQTIEMLRADLEKKYLRGQTLKKTIADLNQIKKEMPELESIFLESGQELKLVTTLEQIADRHQLEQNIALDIEGEKNDQLIKTIPFQFTVKGKFKDVLRYIADIEQLSWYLNVSDLNIIAQNTGRSSASISSSPLSRGVGLAPNSLPSAKSSAGFLQVELTGQGYINFFKD